MNRLLALAAVAVIGAFGVFLWTGSKPTPPGLDLGAANAQAAGDIDTSMVAEMRLGNPGAAVTVVEYASFTCPHCRNFHVGPFKELKADYIDPGKIDFVYREVFFDRFGLWAAMLARCGGEERYFGFVDVLYETQSSWAASGDPATIADNLRRIGRTAGLSDDQVNACLQNQEMAQALVAVYQENASADGVNSTPTFLVNGTIVRGNDWPALKAAIDEALGG